MRSGIKARARREREREGEREGYRDSRLILQRRKGGGCVLRGLLEIMSSEESANFRESSINRHNIATCTSLPHPEEY